MQFAVLGPLEVNRAGCSVDIGGRKQRIALAALIVALNHSVSIDTLSQAVWSDIPPRAELDTIQSMMSRLRSCLGHDAIELTNHSYRLVADPEQVDAVRFERKLGTRPAGCRTIPPPPS